jgi:hypothetical protein
MSRVRKTGFAFVLSLAMLCASIGVGSAKGISNQSPQTQSVTVVQEDAVVGGSEDVCSFLAGFAVGAGIGGLLGCVPCAAAALGADIYVLAFCINW